MRFSHEADAERLAEDWFKKAEEIMSRPGASVRWKIAAAKDALERAYELQTMKLEVLERNVKRYDTTW